MSESWVVVFSRNTRICGMAGGADGFRHGVVPEDTNPKQQAENSRTYKRHEYPQTDQHACQEAAGSMARGSA